MREWVYQTAEAAPLAAGIPVYQASRLIKVPKGPHVIYRMGITQPALGSEEAVAATTPFQLFVHDVPGDYGQVDQILGQLVAAFTAFPPLVVHAKLIRCRWLENSPDLPEDPLTGTIAKFARFLLAHKT